MAITRLKDGRWLVYYRARRPDGKPYLKREYFGRGPEGEAAAREHESHLNLKPRRPPDTSEGPTFAEIARAYFNTRQHTSASRTRENAHIRMTKLLLPFFGPMIATRINDADLEHYIALRRSPSRDGKRIGVGYSTIRRELVDLKAAFSFAARRKPPLIAFNPIRDFKLPREERQVIMPPTAAEFSAILAAAPDHLRRICLITYYCGLRPGPVECYRLRWEMVDWKNATILIQSARKGGPVARSVPIHKEFLPVMQAWHSEDKEKNIPWIVSWGGRTVGKINTTWAFTLKQAGIYRRIRPYDVRHLFITQALESGADIGALSDIVGSSPQTLRKFYQHVTTPLLRRTVDLIQPVEIPPGDTKGTITKQ